VFIHYDKNAPEAEFAELGARLAGNPRAVFVADRIRCGWGEFGLAQAPLNAIRQIAGEGPEPDYVYLISGSCLPVRPLAELNRFLDEAKGAEFIQAQDEGWMLAGLRRERYEFFFPLNFKRHRRAFNGLVRAQRWLGVKRRVPDGLEPRFGSQWWCLTWATCRAILRYLDSHPEVVRFFRLTWIPDESFFQTLVYRLVDRERIAGKTLTLYQFSGKGKPVVFFDEHETWLRGQNFFFARKVAAEARGLREKLAEIAAAPDRGRPFVEIGRTTPFYQAALSIRAERERPGQMFRANQRLDAFPGALSRNRQPYVVLYGPGPATRIAATALQNGGMSVLGRLFHRERVGFADRGETLAGLTSKDVAIRDFDPSLYLCRVLDRAPPLPVIEISPADGPIGAALAVGDPNCLFAACLPQPDLFGLPTDWDVADWRLFFALSVLDPDSGARPDFSAAWADLISSVGDDRLWSHELQRIVEPYLGGPTAELLGDALKPGAANHVALGWGAGPAGPDSALADVARTRRRWRHSAGLPEGALEGAILSLADASISDADLAAPEKLKKVLMQEVQARLLRPGRPPRYRPELVPRSGASP
jgi:hypothetical protein